MKRKSGKKRAAKKKILQSIPLSSIQQRTRITPRQTILERVRNHPLYLLFGILASFLPVFYAVSDAFRDPDISHSTAQVDDPFFVHFSLHNPSVIFPMTDMRLNCVLKRVGISKNLSLVDIPIDDGMVANIQPGKTVEYECPVHKAIDEPIPILQATIRIDATFRTLGFHRTTKSELFNWDIISRQWIKGEIIN